jgi:hypothetical protein
MGARAMNGDLAGVEDLMGVEDNKQSQSWERIK